MRIADLAKPEIVQFLWQPLYACMATIGPDDTPHQTYVWYTWDDQEFLVSTTKNRVKHRNIVRNPRVSLAIADLQNPYRYVSISGTARVTEQGAGDLIIEESIRYMGEEKGRPYGEQMRTPDRVVVHIKPERVMLFGF